MEAAFRMIAVLFALASGACIIACAVLVVEIGRLRKPGVPLRRTPFSGWGNIVFHTEDLTAEALRARVWLVRCFVAIFLFAAIAFGVGMFLPPQAVPY
jgi:hypothetical protein